MMLKFITSNPFKFSDAFQSFKRNGINIKQEFINVPEIQASSAEEVCRAKVVYVSDKINGDFFIEDSSFHIPALNGFPGVYVRYIVETLGVNGIITAMKGLESRGCFFRSCVIYRDQDGQQHEFTFIRDGLFIMDSISTKNILGWSSLWSIIGITSEGCTYAELKKSQQDKLTHYWQKDNSFIKLINFIRSNYNDEKYI